MPKEVPITKQLRTCKCKPKWSSCQKCKKSKIRQMCEGRMSCACKIYTWHQTPVFWPALSVNCTAEKYRDGFSLRTK